MLNTTNYVKFWLFFVLFIFIISCNDIASKKQSDGMDSNNKIKSEQEFINTLKKHLDAISTKNLDDLKSTMSPEGKMQLILPGSEILNSVDSFIDYHQIWFQDTSWSFETKIIDTQIGDKFGIAITQIIYREPERNGMPYYNRMIVSYGLEKLNKKWYIIKDHASSIEKSTDIKSGK